MSDKVLVTYTIQVTVPAEHLEAAVGAIKAPRLQGIGNSTVQSLHDSVWDALVRSGPVEDDLLTGFDVSGTTTLGACYDE